MGIEASGWLQMYLQTHDGTRRIEWVDGGTYFEQLAIVPEVWGIIAEEILLYRKEKGTA